jgi:hypothetical protein
LREAGLQIVLCMEEAGHAEVFVIVRQRVRPKAGPLTGSGGRSSLCAVLGEGWIPRLRGV